ncbi:hypothetical protein CYMTET_32196 [Cymbomonas tetramitiformis]|uniref:Uncharacterized protein n=1 Tax=Cymbomonas tetramitiformis TaxID=36881 RepID=A0AAE0FFG9_9CHLO|nr:hypothetical protein CYMTET_32196 [Cymbomonas tetramitiformis]
MKTVKKLSEAARFGHIEAVLQYLAETTNELNRQDKAGFTPLARACENGHVPVVEALLGCENISVVKPNKNGKGPLHLACERGHVAVVRKLLDHQKTQINSDTSQLTPLILACKHGRDAVVEMLLQDSRTDVNKSAENIAPPLWYACDGGHLKSVEYLLKHPEIDVNKECPKKAADVKEERSASPLSQAIRKGHVEVVALLAKSGEKTGLSVNTPDEETGFTPLMVACEEGHAEVVEILLEHGNVDPNFATAEHTSLTLACRHGHYDVVQLLAKTADMSLCPPNGNSSLQEACKRQHADIVKFLLDRDDIDVNKGSKDGRSPLHETCWHRHVRILALMLNRKRLNVNVLDTNGRTPLHEACARNNTGVVRQLLKHKDINVKLLDTHRRSALWIACEQSVGNKNEIVKILLTQPSVDLNRGDEVGRSPLWRACENNNVALAELLLAQPSINVNAVDQEAGRTPLHNACRVGNKDLVKLLLRKKEIKPNIGDRGGQTALGAACDFGLRNLIVVRLMLTHENIDINKTDRCKRTPLWWMCRNGNTALVEELLKAPGIEVNNKDVDGRTPLFIACFHGHRSAAELLFKARKLDMEQSYADNEGAVLIMVDKTGIASTRIAKFKKDQLAVINRNTSGRSKQDAWTEISSVAHARTTERVYKTPILSPSPHSSLQQESSPNGLTELRRKVKPAGNRQARIQDANDGRSHIQTAKESRRLPVLGTQGATNPATAPTKLDSNSREAFSTEGQDLSGDSLTTPKGDNPAQSLAPLPGIKAPLVPLAQHPPSTRSQNSKNRAPRKDRDLKVDVENELRNIDPRRKEFSTRTLSPSKASPELWEDPGFDDADFLAKVYLRTGSKKGKKNSGRQPHRLDPMVI